MRRWNIVGIVTASAVLSIAGIWRTETTMSIPPSSAATAPTTRPLPELLQGTFDGTVVDDGERVRCVTRFQSYRGNVKGQYAVREGRERYLGTLSDFVLVDADQLICRFHWKDKHGEGLLTIQVTPDGQSFAGSWGKEVVQEELIWTGTKEEPASRPSSQSGRRERRAQ